MSWRHLAKISEKNKKIRSIIRHQREMTRRKKRRRRNRKYQSSSDEIMSAASLKAEK